MSLLNVPRSASSGGTKRHSARLDLLTAFLNSPQTQSGHSSSDSDSPRDSLSPLDDRGGRELEGRGRSRSGIGISSGKVPSSEGRTRSRITSARGSSSSRYARPEASSRDAQTPYLTFQQSDVKHEAATPALSTNQACSPRSPLITREHRPSNLTLTRTNGLTTITAQELKQQIAGDDRTDNCTAITQVPRRPPKRLPKTPILQIMGNKPSSVSDDDASDRSVVRNPVRILRKSSTNLFKRIDSKSPLPPELTRTVIEVQQQVSPITDDNDENDESLIDPFMDGNISPNSPDVPPVAVHSASTVTITNDNAALRRLSASTTIRDSRVDSRRESRLGGHTSFMEDLQSESDYPSKQPSPVALHHRSLALSPSIPAPSPLPEDSPHKYGLKDRMDTPEVPEPEDINVIKARRRSSGLDIFNVSLAFTYLRLPRFTSTDTPVGSKISPIRLVLPQRPLHFPPPSRIYPTLNRNQRLDYGQLRHYTALFIPLTLSPIINPTALNSPIEHLLRRAPPRTLLQTLRLRIHAPSNSNANEMLSLPRPASTVKEQMRTGRVFRVSY